MHQLAQYRSENNCTHRSHRTGQRRARTSPRRRPARALATSPKTSLARGARRLPVMILVPRELVRSPHLNLVPINYWKRIQISKSSDSISSQLTVPSTKHLEKKNSKFEFKIKVHLDHVQDLLKDLGRNVERASAVKKAIVGDNADG
jgi:hypothetical protein